jgi:hypothetical protein
MMSLTCSHVFYDKYAFASSNIQCHFGLGAPILTPHYRSKKKEAKELDQCVTDSSATDCTPECKICAPSDGRQPGCWSLPL